MLLGSDPHSQHGSGSGYKTVKWMRIQVVPDPNLQQWSGLSDLTEHKFLPHALNATMLWGSIFYTARTWGGAGKGEPSCPPGKTSSSPPYVIFSYSVSDGPEPRTVLCMNNQCCGTGMFIPEPGTWFLSIQIPEYRIPCNRGLGNNFL